ncbi:hypothetical protein ACV56Z_10560 [Staphylococcus aureus]
MVYLWANITICLLDQLIQRENVCKDTHRTIIRLSPPLVIDKEEIHQIVAAFQDVFKN